MLINHLYILCCYNRLFKYTIIFFFIESDGFILIFNVVFLRKSKKAQYFLFVYNDSGSRAPTE